MKDRKRDAVNCKRRTERGKEKKASTLLGLLSRFIKFIKRCPRAVTRVKRKEKKKKQGGKKNR